MKEITSLTVGGQSYAITDPTKLPQPENPAVGNVLTVEAVEEGKVSRVSMLPAVQVQNRYVVNMSLDECRILDDPEKIFRFHRSGRDLVLAFEEESPWAFYLPLVEIHYDLENDSFWNMVFSAPAMDNTIRRAIVHADGSCDWTQYSADSQGDISAALDHIIALQESLIGGDSQ